MRDILEGVTCDRIRDRKEPKHKINNVKEFRRGVKEEEKHFKNDFEKLYYDKLCVINKIGDTELLHIEADELLCKFLEELGFNELVKYYKKIPKWYS